MIVPPFIMDMMLRFSTRSDQPSGPYAAALETGRKHRREALTDTGWLPMDTAPRDGTPVELRCSFGVAPWYGLYLWIPNDLADADHPLPSMRAKGHWVSPHKPGSPIDERHLRWRPYHGDPADYVDPTGGAQDDMAYWRGAAADRKGLPLDHFETKSDPDRAARKAHYGR